VRVSPPPRIFRRDLQIEVAPLRRLLADQDRFIPAAGNVFTPFDGGRQFPFYRFLGQGAGTEFHHFGRYVEVPRALRNRRDRAGALIVRAITDARNLLTFNIFQTAAPFRKSSRGKTGNEKIIYGTPLYGNSPPERAMIVQPDFCTPDGNRLPFRPDEMPFFQLQRNEILIIRQAVVTSKFSVAPYSAGG
jgi:hypothetical protein